MMRRAAIRAAIVSRLQGIPSAPTITVGQAFPYSQPSLPAIDVGTGAEERNDEWYQQRPASDDVQVMGCAYVLRLTVAGGVAQDDALDALALEVHQALLIDADLGGAAHLFRYEGSGVPELSDELDVDVGVRDLEFSAEYRVNLRDPQSLEG